MRCLENLVGAALTTMLVAIPFGLMVAIIAVAANILYVLTHAKPVKGEETMVSIMMKPADARGKYTVLAGLEPSNRKPLCTIRAKNILAADKALLGILEKALAGLDIDAEGPAEPPASAATETPPAPMETDAAPADEPVADGAITDGSAAEAAP